MKLSGIMFVAILVLISNVVFADNSVVGYVDGVSSSPAIIIVDESVYKLHHRYTVKMSNSNRILSINDIKEGDQVECEVTDDGLVSKISKLNNN